MATTGEVNYKISADASGMTSELSKAERSVKGLDKAQDKAAKSAGNIGKQSSSIDKLKKSFKGLGATVAGLGIGLAFKKMVDNTARQEAALVQLNTTLNSTEFAAGKTADELTKTAASLQEVTKYGDEAIIEMQSLLLTFKDIKGDQFDRTTEAILDMATAMKVDLKSATIQLGKALNDPARNLSALTRSGIQFNEAQTEMIKQMQATGDMAGAQAIILKELESQFGNSAKAARDTLGGALAGLSNAWNDLFEAESEATDGMKESIGELEDLLTDPNFKKSMAALVQALIDITGWAIKAVAGLSDLGRTIGEKLATAIHGIAIDDVPALEKRLDGLNKHLATLAESGQVAGSTVESIKKEIAELEEKLRVGRSLMRDYNDQTDQMAEFMGKADERLAAANSTIDEGIRLLAALNDEQDDAVDSLGELSEIVVTATRKTGGYVASVSDVTTATEKATEAQDPFQQALQDTAARIDEAFAEAWRGSFDSFNDFASNIKDAFKSLLAEMAHLAITRPIVMSVGAAFGMGGSGAASAATGGIGGLGSVFSAGKSFLGNGFGSLGGGYQKAGMFLRDMGFEGLGNKSFNLGLDYANQGLGANLSQFGLNLGAGVLGGLAGNAVFGDTTGIGSAIGGIGGSLFGPVGTGIGSFLGSGAERVLGNVLGFGGSGGNQAGAAEFNLLTGSTNAYGIGNSFDQANVDAAGGIANALQQFAAILGGSDFSGRIKVGNRSGIKLDGTKYGSPEELFQAVFDEIVDGANNLDGTLKALIRGFEGTSEEVMAFSQAVISMNDAAGINTVTQAIKDFNTETPTMYRAIEKSNNALHNMIATFDGSAGAAVQLNQALIANKAAAYEMALAIQSIGAAIAQQGEDQARAIRESVMTEEERLASLRSEREGLRQTLGAAVDPEVIAQTSQRLLEINQLIFDSLGPIAQQNRAEMFATQAENIAAQAERRLDVSLSNLQASQEDINQKINALLQENAAAQQQAANTQLSAAQIMLQAARAFGAAPEVNI